MKLPFSSYPEGDGIGIDGVVFVIVILAWIESESINECEFSTLTSKEH